jgi:drug/metabolite transporter (DMT)-like permease
VRISVYLAAAVILAGNAVLSLGNSLQKLNIGWMNRDTAPGRSRSILFFGWLAGFLMMNSVPVFQFIALLGLPANVVAAFAGSNVAFTAIFARLLLGERLGLRRALWTLVLFAAIAGAGLLGRGSASESSFSPPALFIFFGLPILAALILLLMYRDRVRMHGDRARGLGMGGDSARGDSMEGDRALSGGDSARWNYLAPFFAAVSGCFGGYMVIAMRALQLDTGAALSLAWLSSPYLYVFLVCGCGGFSIVQLAYKEGEMARVAPALYGIQVLWPAVASYFVFNSPFVALQATAFLVVAVSVVAIAGDRNATTA